MDVLQIFLLVVIYTTVSISHVSSDSPCSENVTVDGEVSSKNPKSSKDPRRRGSCCAIKTCVSLCYAQIDGWRLDVDNVTFPKVENIEYNETHPIVEDPCRFNWMASSVSRKFKVLPNGLLQASDHDGGSLSDLDEYCLFRKPDSDEFLAKVCRPWVKKDYWDILGLIIAVLVMLTILVGSTTIPEMRNLHGVTFRCYIAAYIATYVCALASEFSTQKRTRPDFYTTFETMTRYSGGCCLFWLNAMSFNIWRTFRWLTPVNNNVNRFERGLFMWYSIHACVTPAFLVVIFPSVVIYTVPQFEDDILRHAFKNWGCAAIILIILVCNGIFYILTSLEIKRHHEMTTRMADGLNKHHEVDRRWFSLYMKLFVIMGGHLIMWPIFFIWPTPEVTHTFAALEVLQSILIFYISLWRTEFKVFVSSALDRMIRSLKRVALIEQIDVE